MMKHLLHFLFTATIFITGNTVNAQSTNINGPAGSGKFGTSVTVLTNGNYVIVDHEYDDGPIADVGAVYLYNGSTHALISMLKGSTANDLVGNFGVTALSNGNFVVRSPHWDNGAAMDAGAFTWGNGTTGVSGIVSSSNSLVGSSADDFNFSTSGITSLSNGNYVVRSFVWDNGAIINAGAVTWGNGSTGTSGVVNSSNSLVGSTAEDRIGYDGVTALSNGNYVVRSQLWDNGAVANAGSVSWGNGSTGTSGIVSSGNSLVGSKAEDRVGNGIITTLSNGNYVVTNSSWANGAAGGAGAVTWGSGSTGISGVINSSNSLVGSTNSDYVGGTGVTALSNGNYVVRSSDWDNGAATNAGAVTWGNGNTGISGVVSSSNSLVGSTAGNQVGNNGLTVLSNGNYVVNSAYWDNGGVTDAGAVTWGNGSSGVSGIVSSSNSLVGINYYDFVGIDGVIVLPNGNYVVRSPIWDNGAAIDAGAVTWGNGNTGVSGVVGSSNSLVSSTAYDNVGSYGVTGLTNGNYLVNSTLWDNGAFVNAGAVTWCNGSTGRSGVVSSSNSLVGNKANDNIGNLGVTTLSNGNYVVASSFWNNGAATRAGAVTWGNGSTGIFGIVSSSNSLVGSTTNNYVGNNGIAALTNGNYVVNSYWWDNGAITDVGAVTWGNGSTGISGIVSNSNSLVGSLANDQVGNGGITALSNGNFIVRSTLWDNGAATDAGAVTWGNGSTGVSGIVNSSNSLVGGTANDNIGSNGIIALSNGNFIVRSRLWDNGAATNAGAVTWGNGSTGISGVINSSNSLVGSTTNDQVGINEVNALSNANYVIRSSPWSNGAAAGVGAVSWGNGAIGVSGLVTGCNSVRGTAVSAGNSLVYANNSVYGYLIVGRPSDNIVTIFNASGMSLANTLDAAAVNITGTNAVPLIANTGCRIIATLTPNGGSQVNGTVNAKAWIEPTVPTYAGYPFVARHYEITPSTNASTATAKVTLYFTQQEFTDFNAHPTNGLDLPTDGSDAIGKANLRVGKFAGTSSDGSGLPGTYSSPAEVINPIDTDIVWNNSLSRWEVSFNVTGFSGFIVQTYTFVLPLTLLEFNGRLISNNGVLNWKTNNELNAHSFDVERSIDGRTYTKVGNVAAFNTSGYHHYNFTDNNIHLLAVPVVYYRLKQKDIGGRFTYSRIVALSIDDSKSIVLFYPNPVTTEANLTITINKAEQVKGRIIDNTGRVVKQMQWNVAAGSTVSPVDVKGLSSGMYWLELIGATINERKVFVKQ